MEMVDPTARATKTSTLAAYKDLSIDTWHWQMKPFEFACVREARYDGKTMR